MAKLTSKHRWQHLMNDMRFEGIDHWELILPETYGEALLRCRQWVRQNLRYVPSDHLVDVFSRFYFDGDSLRPGSTEPHSKDRIKEAVIAMYRKENESANRN